MHVVLDVETKNLGCDVIKDNEQLLSFQLGDATEQELYYYDSKDKQSNLEIGKKRIMSLLSQGVTFAGFNIKNFDISILKQFLGVEIPDSNIFDLYQTPRVCELRNMKIFGLERVCGEYGIGVVHKRKMNERAEKCQAKEVIQIEAKAKALEVMKKKGGTFNYAFNEVLHKIAYGHAVWGSYLEFVESGGQKNTLFYEYAIGDVICEHQLLKKLGY